MIKVCSECGITDKETRIYGLKKFGRYLCRKHYLQMCRHGKIYKRTIYDPNAFIIKDDHALIELYDKFGEVKDYAKIYLDMVDKCKQYKWYLRPNGYCFGSVSEKDPKIKLHNFVLGSIPPKGLMVDHINGDKLDNRLLNFRIVTQQENAQNMHKKGKTVGVNYGKHNGVYRWIPRIMVDGKNIWLGVYDTEEEAIKVRKEAELKYFTVHKQESLNEIPNPTDI